MGTEYYGKNCSLYLFRYLIINILTYSPTTEGTIYTHEFLTDRK